MKSSSKPKEISDLEDCHVQSIAMGTAHTLFLVSNETDAEKSALEALPDYDPEAEAAA